MALGRRVPVAAAAGVTSALLLGALTLPLVGSPPREPVQVVLAPEPAPASDVTVYVSGAVSSPGLYVLPVSGRVQDALESAGGPGSGADLDRINLAERLRDGAHVFVPRAGEPMPEMTGPRRVNLNTASEVELEALRGIGKVRAQRMIASRREAGPFAEPFDLVTRGLVPLGVYQQIRDLVTAP